MTGTNDNRPDFQKMIKDSANQDFQYIIVYKLDRFSRNKYETAKYKKILKDNGVKLLSAMENIPDTPEGIILESLLEGMAEYYSAELAQKVKRGMRETRLKGNFQGGYLLYGYKVENKKILIDEEQAEIVRYIYKQYSLGMYVKDILNELNEKHILNRNRPFTRVTLYNTLRNEKYTGIYRYENEIFENMYPAIISKELFDSIRLKTTTNKKGSRSVKTKYMLRDKLKCGYCGRPISAETGTSRNGTMRRYYKCFGRKSKNGCCKENVRKEELEKFVIDTLLQALKNESIMNVFVKRIMEIQRQNRQDNTILDFLKKEKSEKEKTLTNLMSAIEQGLINVSTIKRINELEKEIEELEKAILIEESQEEKTITKKDIENFYIQALNLEPQQLINYLVKEIIVFDERIEIKFNSPLKTSPNKKGSSFLSRFEKANVFSINKFDLHTFNVDMCV